MNQLNRMIENSQNVELRKPDDYFFSYGNQKKIALQVAMDLLRETEGTRDDVDDVLDTTEYFINTFYRKFIAKK